MPVTNTFSPNTRIKSSQVNTNFTDITTGTALNNITIAPSLANNVELYFKSTAAANDAFISESAGDILLINPALNGIVVNENGGDRDFRIESDGNANMFFVDGGNNRIGIGTNSPSDFLDCFGKIRTSYDGTNYGVVYASSTGNLVLQSEGSSSGVSVDPANNVFFPISDNAITCGVAGNRWSDLQSVLINGVSCLKEKNVEEWFDENNIDWLNNLPRLIKFKWKKTNDANKGASFIGFVGDDLPDTISNKETGSVNVLGVIAYAFGAITQLKKEITDLKNQINV